MKSLHIVDVVTSPGLTGFYTDDQGAIKAGAKRDGFIYSGSPVTPGFTSIRQPGQSLSVQLVLSDGQVAYGDCATVQYAGVGGREGPLKADRAARVIQEEVVPWLRGSSLDSFRDLCQQLQGLPLAVQYGVSQAILDAMARSRGLAMCEVVAQEWGLSPQWKMIPILTQSGDDRYLQVDKMILKQVAVLPHGLFNSLDKVGPDGEGLLEYISGSRPGSKRSGRRVWACNPSGCLWAFRFFIRWRRREVGRLSRRTSCGCIPLRPAG